MAHKHSVRDVGAHFLIDQFTRQIKNDSANKTTIVQYDHNSERLTFEIPLYVDGHAMTLCDLIEIHYINISTDGNSQNPGTYEVNDIKAEGENAVFTWLISQECTQLAGSLNFFIVFKCTENGVTVYRWGTEIYKNLPISAGMDNGEAVLTEYPDILAQWKAQLFSASDTAVLNVATAEANALAAIEAAGEAKKQSVLDSIPDEYEEVTANVNTNTAKINELANAIKGNLSGYVVRADDVSPVKHNPIVKVHGKNWLNIPNVTKTIANTDGLNMYGEIVDGHITLSGTFNGGTPKAKVFRMDLSEPTVNYIGYEIIKENLAVKIPKGTYIFSANQMFNIDLSGVSGAYLLVGEIGGTETNGRATKYRDGSKIVVSHDDYYAQFVVYLYSDNPVENFAYTAQPQLEKGTTVTEYTPYIDPATVTVRLCEKNIFDLNAVTGFFNGNLEIQPESLAKIDNGMIISNLGLYGVIIMCNPGISYLPKGEYALSVDAMSNRTAGNKQVKVVVQFEDGTYTTCINHNLTDYGKWEHLSGIIKLESGKMVKGFAFQGNGESGDYQDLQIHFKNIQLEVAEESDYEPYNGAIYTPAADGVVSGVTSLSPCMTILTDTEGVTVECEYNRDTNKVIADILERIEALKNA